LVEISISGAATVPLIIYYHPIGIYRKSQALNANKKIQARRTTKQYSLHCFNIIE
jgi:pyruvate dehydrogenase complex dehydrogenase (E1) component